MKISKGPKKNFSAKKYVFIKLIMRISFYKFKTKRVSRKHPLLFLDATPKNKKKFSNSFVFET
jgi:hypothetical protein